MDFWAEILRIAHPVNYSYLPPPPGVTLPEGARGQETALCPLIKKRLRKVQEIEARNVREPCGLGSRDLLIRASEAPVFFNAETAFFKANFYIRLLRLSDYGK